MRRTGRTPIDVNAASHQKTVSGACVPLSTEGIVTRNPKDIEKSRVEIIQPDEFLKLLGEDKRL